MSSARDAILARLRRARLTAPAQGQSYPVRDWSLTERIRRFRERMEAVRGEVHEVTRSDWSARLHQLASARGVANLLAARDTAWGRQLYADWSSAGHASPVLMEYDQDIEAWKERLFHGVEAGFTSSRAGIAETGSLVVWPSRDEPRTLSLVPPVHFVLLEASQVFSTLDEVMREQGWRTAMPTNALLISGPSKTGDIEGTLNYGVHGPKALVVLLVG